ncbi:Hypothetical protein, putative, partial [Bodo saltans]
KWARKSKNVVSSTKTVSEQSADSQSAPPPLTLFSAFGRGAWTAEQWAIATKAAHAFPEPYKAELLEDCASQPLGRLFLVDYKRSLHSVTLLEAQPSAKKHRTEESESRLADKPLNPSHPSVFDAFEPEGEWTKEQWNIAAEEANAMPEPSRTQLLDRCPPSALRHLLSCRRYVTPVPRTTHLSPTDYFVKCIQQNPYKAISVTHYYRGLHLGVSNYAASARGAKRFNARNVFSDCCEVWRTMRRLPLVNPERSNSRLHAEPGRVHVLTGESGSGKTTWALTRSSVGIYLTPDDFNAADLARINGYGHGKHSEEVFGMVRAAMTAVLDGVLDFSVKPSGEAIDVLVVLDDFVEHHRFVREITNVYIPPWEGLFNFDVKKLTFIVIGSIADPFASNQRLSWFDAPYLLSMPSSLSMLAVITDAVERRCGPSASTLIKAIKGHSLVMVLIQNAAHLHHDRQHRRSIFCQ